MGLGPGGKVRGVLMPVNHGRLITLLHQLRHRTLVGARQHEGSHGVFVGPGRQCPKRQVGVPESRGGYIPARPFRLYAAS
jgi:hypothetical protein